MPNIKISEFKGILTDADPNTIPFEYVKESRNVRYYPGYAKTEVFDDSGMTNSQSNVLWEGYVWFKEDYLSEEFKGQYNKRYLVIYKEPRIGGWIYSFIIDSAVIYGFLSTTVTSDPPTFINVTNYNGEVQIATNLFYKKISYYSRNLYYPKKYEEDYESGGDSVKTVVEGYYAFDLFPLEANPKGFWGGSSVYAGYDLVSGDNYFRVLIAKKAQDSADFAMWDHAEYGQVKFLITYVYDGRNEVVSSITSPTLGIQSNPPYFFFNATVRRNGTTPFPENLTGMNIYIKLKSISLGWDLDFTRVASIDLTKNTKIGYVDDEYYAYKFNVLISASTQGATLSSAIGVYWDEELPPRKITTGVNEYKEIGDVAFIRTQESVYPCIIGNGLIQKGNFYYNTQIPIVNSTLISKMVEMNNDIGVITNDSMKVFKIDNYEGVLVFTPKGDLPYKIYDTWEIGGQLFMVTPVGILVTGGDSVDNISRPIADKIRADYENIKVAYNKFKAEVYAVMEGLLYVYDYKTQTWTSFDLPQLDFDKFIKTDEAPKLGTLQGIYEIKFKDSDRLSSILRWHNTNLNEMGLYKKLDKILFEGEVNEGSVVSNNSESKTIKPITRFSFTQNPFEKFDIEIKGNFTLYNMEVLFDVIPKQWNKR